MALASDNLNSLQAKIGFEPVPDSKLALEHRFETLPVNDQRQLRENIKLWLTKQGIPHKSMQASLDSSLIKGYCIKAYLVQWRNRANPSFALLGGDDDEADASDEAEVKAEPTATIDAKMIEALVADLVQRHIGQTKLTLDDGAKAQIRALAQTTAASTIAELMPPRTIEVKDMARGEVITLGHQHKMFPKLLKAMQARCQRGFRLNIWLTGPTGSGKTSAAEASAKALFAGKRPDADLLERYGLTESDIDAISIKGSATEKLDKVHFGADGSLDADYKVLGYKDGNGHFHWTTFLKCFAFGYPYCADEIDNWLPSALLSINAPLANGFVATPIGMVQRHPDFVCIACANTWGLGATNDYVGRSRLDAASLDRFQPKINWPYDEELEAALAMAQYGEAGKAWHRIVTSARAAAKLQGLKVIISPRATFGGIALLKAGFDVNEVADMTFLAGLSPEQVKAIGGASRSVMEDVA